MGSNNDPLTRNILIGVVILILVTAVVGIIILVNLVFPSETQPVLSALDPAVADNQSLEIPESSEYTQSLQDSEGLSPVQWDETGRVTVLVMGLDYRDWVDAPMDPSRTDSMILVSMDTQSKTAGMISIPRDLWVDVPGFGETKINTAYFNGQAYNLPGGGPGLAVATVEKFLGIPINYYAQIDFGAFVRFIDEIGGVDINVNQEIVVDPLGPGNTVILRDGVQTLDGATALGYARARNTEHGDFDRAARQQQVVMAVRDNILNYYTLPKLVSQAVPLYQELSSGVKTNMNLYTALKLAWYAQQIPEKNIKQGVISEPDYATAMISWDGQYALVPVMEQIEALKESVFELPSGLPTSSSNPGESASETVQMPLEQETAAQTNVQQPTVETVVVSPQELMKSENARIVVKNGTTLAGLANRTGTYLSSLGLNVVSTGDADDLYVVSEIRVSSQKPETVRYLAGILNIAPSRLFNQGASPDNSYDIVLIIGDDWAANNPMP